MRREAKPKSKLAAVCRAQDGNVSIMMALTLPLFAGIAGVALIYLQAIQQKTALLAGLDAGVLAGTALPYTATADDRVAAAKSAFYANVSSGSFYDPSSEADFAADGSVAPTFTVRETAVSGVATTNVKDSLAVGLGITNMNVKVSSQATKRDSDPICMLSLGKSQPRSMYVYGGAKLNANCGLQANSDDPSALEIDGNDSEITASIIGAAGGSDGTGFTPPPLSGIQPADDPYADLPVPTPGACLMSAAKIKTSITLKPGTYCGGLEVMTGATVTLASGIHIMKDGQFRIDSGGKVIADKVMIALIGKDSVIYMGSDSSAKLTSPTEGTYRNIQFMSDRDLSLSKFEEEQSIISSGAILEFDGTMYLPEQDFLVSGTAHQAIIKAYSPSFAIITNSTQVQGNAVVDIHREDRRDLGDMAEKTFAYGAKLVK